MIGSGMTGRFSDLRHSYVNSFLVLGMVFGLFGYLPSVIGGSQGTQTEWIGPDEGGRLIWGVKGGVVLAVWPSGFREEGVGGPRGLFRIGYERDGKMTLVNFIAVEPVW